MSRRTIEFQESNRKNDFHGIKIESGLTDEGLPRIKLSSYKRFLSAANAEDLIDVLKAHISILRTHELELLVQESLKIIPRCPSCEGAELYRLDDSHKICAECRCTFEALKAVPRARTGLSF